MDEIRLGPFRTVSARMAPVLGLARRVATSRSSLLILGETGVGKEWLARAIHAEGPRASGPFIAVNCGAIPETLLESEMFGHEQGAFTGADHARRGYFELAHGGTLFLDEIAETPPHIQVKLLRVLQDHQILRIGAEMPRDVDVRVIAATNRQLEEEIRAARFRADLYYRLGVVALTIPPLRERKEDIVFLAHRTLEDLRIRFNTPCERFHPQALEALLRYTWPGNVRELVNAVEHAVLMSDRKEVRIENLPDSVRIPASRLPPDDSPNSASSGKPANPAATIELRPGDFERPLRMVRQEVAARVERLYLAELLRKTHGQIGRTARLAGITPRALFEKMRRHGLRKEDFRQP